MIKVANLAIFLSAISNLGLTYADIADIDPNTIIAGVKVFGSQIEASDIDTVAGLIGSTGLLGDGEEEEEVVLPEPLPCPGEESCLGEFNTACARNFFGDNCCCGFSCVEYDLEYGTVLSVLGAVSTGFRCELDGTPGQEETRIAAEEAAKAAEEAAKAAAKAAEEAAKAAEKAAEEAAKEQERLEQEAARAAEQAAREAERAAEQAAKEAERAAREAEKQAREDGNNNGGRKLRRLQEISDFQAFIDEQERAFCLNAKYNMYLLIENTHIVFAATPATESATSCTSVAFHTAPTEQAGFMRKQALRAGTENVAAVDEDAKLLLGTAPLSSILAAFDNADVGKDGNTKYDALANNCATLIRNMFDPLDIKVDQSIIGFVTTRMLRSSTDGFFQKVSEAAASIAPPMTRGGSRALKGLDKKAMLEKVIELYA